MLFFNHEFEEYESIDEDVLRYEAILNMIRNGEIRGVINDNQNAKRVFYTRVDHNMEFKILEAEEEVQWRTWNECFKPFIQHIHNKIKKHSSKEILETLLSTDDKDSSAANVHYFVINFASIVTYSQTLNVLLSNKHFTEDFKGSVENVKNMIKTIDDNMTFNCQP
eukprot:Pgem_evm1s7139